MRIVEKLFRAGWNQLPPETKRRIYTGLKKGDPKAIKDVASIFQIPYKDVMRYLGISMVTGAITAPKAKASQSKVNPDANSIKPLTNAEKAKLQSKGRTDLIAASENPETAKRQYYKKVGAKDPTSELDYPEIGATVDETADFVATLATLGGYTLTKSAAKAIATKYLQILGTKGAKAAKVYVPDAIIRTYNTTVKANPKAAAKIQADKELYFPRRISKEEAAKLSKDAIDGKVVYRDYLNASEKEIKDLFGMSKEEFKSYFGANDDNFLWEVKRFFDT